MAPTRRSARLNPVVQPLVDIRDDRIPADTEGLHPKREQVTPDIMPAIPDHEIQDDSGIALSPPRYRRRSARLNPIDQRLIDTRDDGRTGQAESRFFCPPLAGQTTPRKQQSIAQGVTPPDDVLNDPSHIEGGEEHKDDGETVPPPPRKRRRSARLDLVVEPSINDEHGNITADTDRQLLDEDVATPAFYNPTGAEDSNDIIRSETVSTPNAFSQMAKDLGVSEDILNDGISWVEMFFKISPMTAEIREDVEGFLLKLQEKTWPESAISPTAFREDTSRRGWHTHCPSMDTIWEKFLTEILSI
ncbi:hypothetical protein CI102_10001 [Trichoderma harzianum]|nr:hypothetical protein CI102_10001 [Trichoderma harzianum]